MFGYTEECGSWPTNEAAIIEYSTSTLRTEQHVEHIVELNELIEQLVWQLEERIVAIPRGNQRALESFVMEQVLADISEAILVGDDVQLALQEQSERQRDSVDASINTADGGVVSRAVQFSAVKYKYAKAMQEQTFMYSVLVAVSTFCSASTVLCREHYYDVTYCKSVENSTCTVSGHCDTRGQRRESSG